MFFAHKKKINVDNFSLNTSN